MTGCDGERSVNVMRVRRSRSVSRVTLHSQCSNYQRLRSTLLWSGHRNLLTPHHSYVICLKDFNRWSFSEFWVQIHVLHFLERSEYKKMSSSSKWGLSSNWSLSTTFRCHSVRSEYNQKRSMSTSDQHSWEEWMISARKWIFNCNLSEINWNFNI